MDVARGFFSLPAGASICGLDTLGEGPPDAGFWRDATTFIVLRRITLDPFTHSAEALFS